MQRGIHSQSNNDPLVITLFSWLYGHLIFAYPTAFRQEYGELMVQLFRDEARTYLSDGKTAVFIQFLFRTIFDLTKTIFIEHIEAQFNISLEGSAMSYHNVISESSQDPEKLEQLYHDAIKAGDKNAFKTAIDDLAGTEPTNQLLAAWYVRLNYAANQAKRFLVEWQWLIPLALFNGFWFWLLSDIDQFMINTVGGRYDGEGFMPAILLWAGGLTALFILIYFAMVGQKNWFLFGVMSAVPLLAAGYVQLTFAQTGIRPFQQQYLGLMVPHLIVLSLVCVSGYLLKNQHDAKSRMSLLLKVTEIMTAGGVFLIAFGIFTGITIGLFAALDVEFSEDLLRAIYGFGVGGLAVVTAVIAYNPKLKPSEQQINAGFLRLITTMTQVLLPLTLFVLIIYIAFIPANFRAPFDNRDVLITYNIMLFAVVGLLVASTIVRPTEMSPEREKWLRRLIISVAVLTLIVSFYALSAIVFRTINDRLTPNRLTFIGWNLVNIALLIWLLVLQLRTQNGEWIDRLYQAFSQGTAVYSVWTVVLILSLPWIFGINQGEIESLPSQIQNIVYEEPSPVLLKCADLPHIYLLDGGEKRWIKDIETFNDRGYVWGDVNFVNCSSLQQVPDGVPIPANAGSPP